MSPEDKLAELGMLAVHKDYLRLGLATSLIKAAEERAFKNDCQRMRLEILSPKTWEHPEKKMLKAWYTTKLGYVEGETEDFSKHFPVLKKNLKCECIFTIYIKELTGAQ